MPQAENLKTNIIVTSVPDWVQETQNKRNDSLQILH